MRKYYTVISKGHEDYHNGMWIVQYGSYDKSDCVYEIESYKDRDECNQERIKYKIITTGDAQADVNSAVAKLNAA